MGGMLKEESEGRGLARSSGIVVAEWDLLGAVSIHPLSGWTCIFPDLRCLGDSFSRGVRGQLCSICFQAGSGSIRVLARPLHVVAILSPKVDIFYSDVVAGDVLVAFQADGRTAVVSVLTVPVLT